MASIQFSLYSPYEKKSKKLKTTKCSIYLRFTVDRKHRFSITLGEKIEPKFWDFTNQKVRSSHPRYIEINLYLQNRETEIQNQYYHNRDLPFDKFKKLATQGTSTEKKTLFITGELFLKAYKAEKDEKTLGKYNTLFAQLKAFDEKYPIDFPSLDFNFYDRFKTHLFEIPNPNYRNYSLVHSGDSSSDYKLCLDTDGLSVGLFDDTVYKYFINLKTFCAWSEKRGYQVNQAYKSWEIIERRYPPISLLESELEKLESFDFTIESVKPFTKKHAKVIEVVKAVSVARDYLAFECRTGQRISDIKRFDLKDFADLKWTFRPYKGRRLSSKTRTVYFKGFCASALNILEKYNWKMPVVSDQKLNDNIKTACKIAGINTHTETFRWAQNKHIKIEGPKYEFLSSHSGRKTFITIGLQHLKPKIVKDLAGIESWATLKHYEGDSEAGTIEEALEKMQDNKPMMKKVI